MRAPAGRRRPFRPGRRRARIAVAIFLGSALILSASACTTGPERAFDSAVFAARTGQDATGPLAWIADHPVYWQLDYVDGVYSAVVGLPCAPLSAPVMLDEQSIVVDMDRAAIAAVECDERRAEMDDWVRSFITEPLEYTLEGEVLTLVRGDSGLTFERIDR